MESGISECECHLQSLWEGLGTKNRMKTWSLLLRGLQPRFQRWRLSRCVPGNGLLQWVGGEVWWSKGSLVSGRLACWMCHGVYRSYREEQVSLCPVISPGHVNPLPILWYGSSFPLKPLHLGLHAATLGSALAWFSLV